MKALPKINAIMITIIIIMQFIFLFAVIKQQEQVIHLIQINKNLRYVLDVEINQIRGFFYVGRIYE